MGQSIPGVDCACLTQGFTLLSNAVGEDRAARDRLESLQRGQKFLKKMLLGLSTQEIHLKMSEDTSSIEWRIDATRLSKAEYGEVDLTSKVRCVKLVGTAGMQFISNEGGGEKSLLEVHAEDAAVRDRWALAVNELLQTWEGAPEKKPLYNATAAKTSKKEEYYKQRELELAEKVKQNEERKAKYSAGGMKHVALAMMNRS